MTIPIILATAGLDRSSQTAGSRIEAAVARHFPNRPIHWGYNARTVSRALARGRDDIRLVKDLLKDLALAGHRRAVVQSLHLLPGQEFHELIHDVRQLDEFRCILGMPLFSSFADYGRLIDLLAPLFDRDGAQAVLFVGHGTRHPIWTAYLALEHLLRKRFGQRAFVGVIEHQPESRDLPQRIRNAGFNRVLLVPLFFGAGVHVRRDVMGEDQGSWHSRLRQEGCTVEAIQEGIGLLPGLEQLVLDHIEAADAAF